MSDTSSAKCDGEFLRTGKLEKAQTTEASWSNESHEDLGEVEVVMSSHRRNASAYLGAHLDAQFRLSNTLSTSDRTGALAEGKHDAWEMAGVASRDQLQLHLVPLCSILKRLHRKACKLAIRSGLYFFSAGIAKFVYRTFIPQRLYSENFNNYLSGCIGLSASYGAYRTVMWSLVYLRWRGAASLKHRLDDGQVMEENRHDLNGSSWSQVESYTSILR